MAVNTPENPNRINYFHELVTEHLDDLRDQAKNPLAPREGNRENGEPMQTVVFVRPSTKEKGREGEPERLMTVQEVTETLDLNPSTVRHWVATGRLKERGRIWLARPGGRGTPLVSQAEAEFLKNNPPPMGRPRKRKN